MCYICGTLRIPGVAFTEKFDDHNEADHNIGQAEVVNAIFFEEFIHVSGVYKDNGRARRKILGCTDGLYMTIIVEPSESQWRVLSAMPSDDADRARFKAHYIENPNQLEDEDAEEDNLAHEFAGETEEEG